MTAGTGIAISQDARTRLQVWAQLEGFFVRIQAELAQVVAIDLCNANREIETTAFQHAYRGERFRQVLRLPHQLPADHAHCKRVM